MSKRAREADAPENPETLVVLHLLLFPPSLTESSSRLLLLLLSMGVTFSIFFDMGICE